MAVDILLVVHILPVVDNLVADSFLEVVADIHLEVVVDNLVAAVQLVLTTWLTTR